MRPTAASEPARPGGDRSAPVPFRNLAVLTSAVGVLLLGACGGSGPPHRLELEVTGSAKLTSLTFRLDGKGSEQQAVSLPWRKTVEVPYGAGEHQYELVLRHSGGELFASATVDGQPAGQTAGSGSPGSENTANLSGSFSD